jgi:alginate O-acetyltransferase complex protein AlgI
MPPAPGRFGDVPLVRSRSGPGVRVDGYTDYLLLCCHVAAHEETRCVSLCGAQCKEDFSGMSSQALLYVIVLPVAWLLLWPLKSARSRQTLLLIVSYGLYASFGLRFLALLISSSLLNYCLGILLRWKPSVARLWLGIVCNIVLLGTFKYVPAIAPLLPTSSLRSSLAGIALPVGISFWTFQALSYLFDLYREEELDPSLVEFLLYMTFWPTVLSGPICRLSGLLPQFRAPFKPTAEEIRRGLDRICIGLFMTALGQILEGGLHPGQGIDAIFDSSRPGLTGPDVWGLAIGYGFELFFNFAGYTHIVIGAARLFGFRLDENFDRPYLSTTPSEFWTRWHMSLSFWIRDYLFLPLATLRREMWWRNFVLVLSMVVFGLWHKGSGLFLLWGLYQGVLLVLHRQWQQLRRNYDSHIPQIIMVPLAWLATFSAICLGWVFFRANNLTQAFTMLRSACNLGKYASYTLPGSLYVLLIILTVGYFATIGCQQLLRKHSGSLTLPLELRFVLYAVAVYIGIFHAAQTQAFIYFQF